ncbi:MAG: hypothetical protein Q4A92_02210 [Corynebacterium sp.]|nr:hypothetical protein [Corynebacterium sp.]
MLKHPNDCSRDQLDVRIVVLTVLGFLVLQLGNLSGNFTVAHAIPLALIVYGLFTMGRARLRFHSLNSR